MIWMQSTKLVLILHQAFYRQKTKAMILIHRFFRAYSIVIYNLYNIDFTTVLSDVKPGCIIQNGKIF